MASYCGITVKAKIVVPINNLGAFLGMRRCKNLGSRKSLPENTYLKAGSSGFFPEHRMLISDLHRELLSGGVEGQQLAVVIM